MEADEYVENIRQYILTNKKPSYQTTNKKEVRVRCPYCGDSKSNRSSAHFYIEMCPPFRFHCFKCETSGVLTQNVLRDLELYESNIDLIQANKKQRNNLGIQKTTTAKHKLKNKYYENERSLAALNYFSNRYQRAFNPEYIIEKYKVVLDPISFFEENGIRPPQGQYDFGASIGFISSDSTHIVFRDITGMQPKRYNNLALYNSSEITTISKTYTISNEIDAMADEVNLVITEGIFDIIGVHEFLYQDTKNTIFAAACGKAYNAVILNYIRMGFLKLNITIYSDGDVPISFYKEMKNSSPYLKNNRITIYYNADYDQRTGENKDFGCSLENVRLTKVII